MIDIDESVKVLANVEADLEWNKNLLSHKKTVDEMIESLNDARGKGANSKILKPAFDYLYYLKRQNIGVPGGCRKPRVEKSIVVGRIRQFRLQLHQFPD